MDQNEFAAERWNILPPSQIILRDKLAHQDVLENYLIISEGFISGADDVFIRDREDIPKGEEKIYLPYLSDKEMSRYSVPKNTDHCVFYPIINNKSLTFQEILNDFPKTWEYLKEHEEKLSERKSVIW